jgi:hypothetical protein
MAITRIRGGQIQDRTIEGAKITLGTITNEVIADNAAIAESKLSIDWSGHYQSALETKKVVDYVQVSGTAVGGAATKDLTGIIDGTIAAVDSSSTSEGIIASGATNKVIVRNSADGEAILANIDASLDKIYEVYGKLSFASSKYTLSFFYFDPTANSGAGAEVAFTMPANTTIDWQYLRRFNLRTVSETFAANEKFVDGAVDTSALLNLQQLAKDLYGSSWSLNRDGLATLGSSLKDQIASETTRASTAETALQTNIDNEATARSNADTAIRNDFASTAAAKGANLIGIQDAGSLITATTVEGALAEIIGKVNTNKTDLASTAASKGASTIGIQDSGNIITATTVEGALAEVVGNLNSEITNRTNADTAIRTDFSTINTAAKGANLIGIQDAGSLITATTVEGALAELAGNINTGSSNVDLRIKEIGSVGVQSGLAVTAQATPNMTVAVATGVVYNDQGKRFAPTAGNVTITAASATNPRIDVIYVTSAGALSVVTGTAAASPVAPAVPASGVKLAEVTVPANAATIVAGNIADKRVYISANTEVQTARGNYTDLNTRLNAGDTSLSTYKTDLSSTSASKGASLVGIQDSGNIITATTVEGALAEIKGNFNDLALTSASKGASLVGIQDSGNLITATTVEGALAEIQGNVNTNKSDLAATTSGKGAALVGINDAGSLITATTVEAALQEIVTNLNSEVTNRTNADTSIRNDFASTVAAKGASLIGINDVGGIITATTVEAALQEIQGNVNTYKSDIASTAASKGANLIGIQDAGSLITATTVEGALAEIIGKVNTNKTDLAATTTGKGASLIGIEDAGGKITATTVEGALAEIAGNIASEITNRTNADTAIRTDLSTTGTAAKGANMVGIQDSGNKITATTVEGALAELADRATALESNGGAEVSNTHTRDASTTNSYFVAKTGASAFATLEARLVDIENIADTQFKAAANTTSEVTTARGTAADLNTRLNVALNNDGTLVVANQVHKHKKQTITVATTTNIVTINVLDYYRTGDGNLDVYVNGILQATGANFTESYDSGTKVVTINFGTDNLLVGDVVVVKYVEHYTAS